MEYPVRLLPKSQYKIIEINDLPKETSLIRSAVVREHLDDNGDIRVRAIAEKSLDCIDMSCNQYGMSEPPDLCIRIKDSKERFEKWDGESDSTISDEEWEFGDINPAIFLKNVKSLNNKIYPGVTRTVGKDIETFSVKCIVSHDPMKYNFWHFEIRYFENETWIKKSSSTWKKNFFSHTVMVVLKNLFSPYPTEKVVLDKELYIKSA